MNVDSGLIVFLLLLTLGLAALSYRLAFRGVTYFSASGFVLLICVGTFFLLFLWSASQQSFSRSRSTLFGDVARTTFYVTTALYSLSIFSGTWLGRRRRAATGPYQAKKLTDIDGFVNMLAAACESAEMNSTLERVLSLPDEKRKVLLKEIIETLRNRRAPAELTDAFICLQDDAIAEKAYEALYKCPRGCPIEPMRAAAT